MDVTAGHDATKSVLYPSHPGPASKRGKSLAGRVIDGAERRPCPAYRRPIVKRRLRADRQSPMLREATALLLNPPMVQRPWPTQKSPHLAKHNPPVPSPRRVTHLSPSLVLGEVYMRRSRSADRGGKAGARCRPRRQLVVTTSYAWPGRPGLRSRRPSHRMPPFYWHGTTRHRRGIVLRQVTA